MGNGYSDLSKHANIHGITLCKAKPEFLQYKLENQYLVLNIIFNTA